MHIISGQLKKVANGTINSRKKEVEIGVLAIGDKILSAVKVDQGLSVLLEDGLKTEENTQLWVNGKKIMGIKVGAGPRFYAALPQGFYFSAVFMLLIAVAILATASSTTWMLSIAALVPVGLFVREWMKYKNAALDGGTSI